ncbi:UNVERIFIED_CONTAM: hypothetical protein GTU68_003546 [Idotea baltica]|nr:hypothetical protein [Idotea baltica]
MAILQQDEGYKRAKRNSFSLGLDLQGGLYTTIEDDEILTRLNQDAEDAIVNTYEIIRKRVDQFGVASPNLQLEKGTGRIFLELAGVQDTARVRKLLSNTARLEFRETHKAGDIQNVIERIDREVKSLMIARGMLDGVVEDTVTPDSASTDTTGSDSNAVVNEEAPVTGDVITEASQGFEDNSLNAAVYMNMNNEGARKWADLTKNNKGNAIAIIMDDLVYSYPNVNGMITGGRSQISGNFTVDEAKDLANLLKAGALPISTETKGFNQVGPSLGAENLNSGLISFMIAFLVTIVFMFFYYSSSGLVANIALFVNLFFILGVSAAFNIVFTLPGLAAVVLTMGMAVDANVLIFERIREEQLAGKSFKAAIASGFSNAFSSVMDANITTFLTGLILFTFGLGPIKGFAVSLMIGIVTSLICALFITRLILDRFAAKGNNSIKFGSKMTLTAFSKVNLKMTSRKRVMYGLSGVLVLISIISISINGFRTGVDFKGGRQYQIEFVKDMNPDALRAPMTQAFEGEVPLIRSLGGDKQLLITTSYKFESDDASEEVLTKVLSTCTTVVPGCEPTVKEQMFVGPTVAEDIKNSAYWAVGFSLLVIFLYILLRFRGIRYSVGALAALFHDTVIVLGIFSILGSLDILPFPLEVDQAFIAAILTIIGYSINDTVVVFDRIRENFGEMKSADPETVYNTSLNQTFSRTLITSVTTLLTIMILLLFAGSVIKPFMFALFIGIIVGTYSSIFVASPISLDLMKLLDKPKEPVSNRRKKA